MSEPRQLHESSDPLPPDPAMTEEDSSDAGEFRADGELQPYELCYRSGLLLAAGIFFWEGTGGLGGRSPFVILLAATMSILIVLTLSTQWRVLGNWRCKSHQLLYLLLTVVLTLPLLAILKPDIQFNIIPATAMDTVEQITESMSILPGRSNLFETAAKMLGFLVYCLTLIILIAATGPNQKAGLALIGVGIIVATLLLYPNSETIVAVIFMAIFFRVQWERPMLIPPRLRESLTGTEIDYLRELVREGGLSTGETKLYLEGRASLFQRLLEFKLVEYDSFTRQIFPGRRLVEDHVSETMARGLALGRRMVWILFGLIYFIVPDFIPGPIDDTIVLMICSGAGLDWIKNIFRSRRPMPPAPYRDRNY